MKIAFFVIHLLLVVNVVKGGFYEFILDNDEIFDVCPEIPGSRGVNDGFDLRDLHIEFSDGHVSVTGNVTCIWEGLQPTDRIQGTAEFYKFNRGTWQLTPYTVSVKDFCMVQFEPNSIWFQVWSKYIPENERKCVTNFDHTYHHDPFSVDTVFEFPINMEGRYKIIAHAEAFDRLNIRRPQILCFQIFGEFVKVKKN